jgi:hypothetical protein
MTQPKGLAGRQKASRREIKLSFCSPATRAMGGLNGLFGPTPPPRSHKTVKSDPSQCFSHTPDCGISISLTFSDGRREAVEVAFQNWKLI